MRVTVFFYRPLAPDSVLLQRLRRLSNRYDSAFWIGGTVGFGVDNLNWHEALTLAAKIVVNVLKTDSSSIFDEMRLLVQKESP